MGPGAVAQFGFAALPIREFPERGGQGSQRRLSMGAGSDRRPDLNSLTSTTCAEHNRRFSEDQESTK